MQLVKVEEDINGWLSLKQLILNKLKLKKIEIPFITGTVIVFKCWLYFPKILTFFTCM